MLAFHISAMLAYLPGALAVSKAANHTSPANGGQDYQKYMHQYADKYTGAGGYQKYMQEYTSNSSGASPGQDYEKYMRQYANKYMGDTNATMLKAGKRGGDSATNSTGGQDYQQYMKQYANKYVGGGGYQNYVQQYTGTNSSGASSGQDYENYISQYASKYMDDKNTTMLNSAGGGQVYQQYMKQYASKYSGGGGYQSYVDKYAGNYTSAASGQGYENYMHQYAGKYMRNINATMLNAVKGGGDFATGAPGSQNYQHFIHQYAGKYTDMGGYQKYMNQYTGGNSSGASSGQDFQKYLQQFADKYMGDTNATMLNSVNHDGGNVTGASGGQNYQHFMHQYADKYMGGYQKYMNQYTGGNSSGPSSGYQKYMNKYAGQAGPVSLFSYAGLASMSPAECDSWHCLCTWREKQTRFLKHTVPGQYSSYALENVEEEYRTHLAALAANLSTSVEKLGVSSQCQPTKGTSASMEEAAPATNAAPSRGWHFLGWHKAATTAAPSRSAPSRPASAAKPVFLAQSAPEASKPVVAGLHGAVLGPCVLAGMSLAALLAAQWRRHAAIAQEPDGVYQALLVA